MAIRIGMIRMKRIKKRNMKIQTITVTLRIIITTIMREAMKIWMGSRKNILRMSSRIIGNRPLNSTAIVGQKAHSIQSLKGLIGKRVLRRMVIRIRALMMSLRKSVKN